MRWLSCLAAACLALLALPAAARPTRPLQHFIYLGQDELDAALPILDRPDISGAEIIYVWRNLEPARGDYDFSMIEHDLALTRARGKGLFVEVLDRFFTPSARYLPQYMLDGPEYGGGLARQFEDRRPGRAQARRDGSPGCGTRMCGHGSRRCSRRSPDASTGASPGWS